MRKVVTVLSAIGASVALASAASAGGSFSIEGSNLPGTNVYNIVMSYDAAPGVLAYSTGVVTTGTYTGAFTRTNPNPFTTPVGNVVVANGQTGAVFNWGATSGAVPGPGGTFTIGTVTITVAAGDTVAPTIRAGLDGFYTTGGSTVAPDSLTGLTIIPEPSTAALLGLGIVGLIVSGRRSRA